MASGVLSRRSLIFGSLSGVAQSVAGIVLIGVGLPVVLGCLGRELYGIFAVISAVSTIGNVASTGLNGALIHYVGFSSTREQANSIILGNVLLSIVVASAVLLAGLVLESEVMVYVLGLPMDAFPEALILYRLLLVSGWALTVGQSFVALLDVQQKNYISNACQFIYSGMYWILLVLASLSWPSLRAMGWAVFFSAWLWLALVIVFALRFWGALAFSRSWNQIPTSMLLQLRYGGQLFFAGQLNWLYEPLTKILTANLFGLDVVALYDIGLRVKTQVWSLFWRLIYPLNPYLASIKSETLVRFVVLDLSRMILLGIGPICVGFVVVAPVALSLWLGDIGTDVVFTSLWLTCGHLVSLVGMPMYHFLIARGGAKYVIVVHSINAVANIVLVLALYRLLGFAAIPVSNALATAGSTVYLLWMQKLRFGTVWLDVIGTLSRGVSAVLLCAGLAFFLSVFLRDEVVSVLSPIAFLTLAAAFYRLTGTFSIDSVQSYVGADAAVSRCLVRMLCRS